MDDDGRNILEPYYGQNLVNDIKAQQKLFEKYQVQNARLETFEDWPPSSPVKKHSLAIDGFYYMQSGDKVKCAFCNLVLSNWKGKETPRERHVKINPNCPIVRKKDSRVPKFISKVRYSKYGRMEVRLATFVSWPRNAKIPPKALADVGFIYIGYRDAVTCFCCACTLYGWDPYDDPFKDHRKGYPFCSFLREQPNGTDDIEVPSGMRRCIDIGYDTVTRMKLGDFIRNLDFLNMKESNTDLDTQLLNLEVQCENDDGFSFDEIKDAYAAFEEKVCIKDFPVKHSSAHNMANSTVCVIERLMSKVAKRGRANVRGHASDTTDFYPPAEEVRLHTLKALIKAGPGSTHCAMIDHLVSSSKLTKYVQTLGREDIVQMLTILKKIPFQYRPIKGETYSEENNAWDVYKAVTSYLILFSNEQKSLYHTLFMDLSNHFLKLLPSLSKEFAGKVGGINKILVQDYEDRNPYIGLDDPEQIKKHLNTVQDLVCSQGYVKDNQVDRSAETTLENIMQSCFVAEETSDSDDKRSELPLLSAVFDHMMSVLIHINNCPSAQKESGNIYEVYKEWLFRPMALHKASAEMVKSCAVMVAEFVSRPTITLEAENMVKEAIDKVICQVSSEAVIHVVKMLNAIVLSERERFVDQGTAVLKTMKLTGALDWKNHMDGAKQLLDTADNKHRKIKDIRNRKTNHSDEEDSDRSDDGDSVYLDFKKKIRKQLTQDRVVVADVKNEGEHIIDVEKTEMIDEMYKRISQSSDTTNSCAAALPKVILHGELSADAEEMIIDAIDKYILKAKTVSPEATKEIIKILHSILLSGRIKLLNRGIKLLEKCQEKGHSLDWKNYIDDAKLLIDTVGELTHQKMQVDRDGDVKRVMNDYNRLMRTLLNQLKRSRATPLLQTTLLTCCENCIPSKTEIACAVTEKGYLDFSKDEALRLLALQKCEHILKSKAIPWSKYKCDAVGNIMESVIYSYNGDGKKVPSAENKLFISIFKLCCGGDLNYEHFYVKDDNDEDLHTPTIYGNIFFGTLLQYVNLHRESSTLTCVAPAITDVVKLATLALQENHENMWTYTSSMISLVGWSSPVSFKDTLPQIMDMVLRFDKCESILSLVTQIYPHNPKAVHDRLRDMFGCLMDVKTQTCGEFVNVFRAVSKLHAEVFTKDQISGLFNLYTITEMVYKQSILVILNAIAEKNPSCLVDFLPPLLDDEIFSPDSMDMRGMIIAGVGAVNKDSGHAAVDYLIKHVDSESNVSQFAVRALSILVRNHVNYMQKYRRKLKQTETMTQLPSLKNAIHDIILILEGKSVEVIAEDVQQQQKGMAVLDTKVDATISTVIAIGDTVVEHDRDIRDLEEGLERVEENVMEVVEDLGETKVKVEEIDNKTMSNAPKWSRDLTKLMNPKADNDWRLLASRLGYSNDDIRSWATQHDPCMALLSEWYATHKTSEASYGVLTALQEMDRRDGVVIVENAMKAAEGVVEDEDFEYPSPPPVFISYQWGIQNEVKLLKQHLNMAGYQCWLDIGQMGGGDKLFAKIDNGIRGAKVVICCVTEKYAQSPNCNREVNLSVNLKKPIIPLLMDKMDWPPKGSMGPIFSEYLFIRFFQRDGEEINDKRYWPIPKFQELLMQLNFFAVPDQKMIKNEYANWWLPMVEEIVIDKSKKRQKPTATQKTKQNTYQMVKSYESPLVFLSYQWGKQPQIKALYKRLTSMGYTVWMDIYQMGGGDSLYDKIDKGMRGCKAVVSCVTQKYALSANCRREVSLADALKKPIIPLLLEQMKWPPDGAMSMVFTELLYISCYQDDIQTSWTGEKYDELMDKLRQFVPEVNAQSNRKDSKNTSSLKAPQKSGINSNITSAVKTSSVKDKGVNRDGKIRKDKPDSKTVADTKAKDCNTDRFDNSKRNSDNLNNATDNRSNNTQAGIRKARSSNRDSGTYHKDSGKDILKISTNINIKPTKLNVQEKDGKVNPISASATDVYTSDRLSSNDEEKQNSDNHLFTLRDNSSTDRRSRKNKRKDSDNAITKPSSKTCIIL